LRGRCSLTFLGRHENADAVLLGMVGSRSEPWLEVASGGGVKPSAFRDAEPLKSCRDGRNE